jgi:DNA-binding response OmpR family regulator
VRPVGESEKAAAMANQEKLDGIFPDREMPTLSGFDLARLIPKSSWLPSSS